jgi:periplasmic protein CpxP/Spy
MSATPRAIVGLIAAAALASVSTLALSQQAGPGGPPTAEQRAAWQAKAEQRMHEHMEMHAKHLHDLLQLRPDQDAALQTLMAALAPSHMDHMGDHHMGPGGPGGPGHMDHHMGPGADGHDDFAKLTTPERLDKMAAMMAEHTAKRQAEFQKHAEAIKAFYAVLSPEQKRAFDAMPPHMMGGMHSHHGDGGEGHGDWGHHMDHGPGGPGAPPPPQ